VETNTNNASSVFIDPWTLLEDYEEANLLRYFNCRRIERKPSFSTDSAELPFKQSLPNETLTLTIPGSPLEREKQLKKRPFETINNTNNNNNTKLASAKENDEIENPLAKKLKQETHTVWQ
jgi:hypothetical protein